MRKKNFQAGFTALEVLLAGFLMTGIIAGAFLVFGALSEKSDLLFGDSDLRQRMRYVEELLRRDLERAVPTAELEWYAELDGLPGPRFNREPFADYGSDGIPDLAELGYNGDTDVSVPGACDNTQYNPDPRCDNALGFIFPHNTLCTNSPSSFCGLAAGGGGSWTPGAFGSFEGNGRLDPGEWLIDIDGNGHFTGEPFWDYMNDPGTPSATYDQNGNLLAGGASLNFQFDFASNLFPVGFALNIPRQIDFIDVDGDGVYSPKDDYYHAPPWVRGDPTPPQDNPLTFLVDESFAAIDGTQLIATTAALYPGGNRAQAYQNLTRALQLLSPFGFIDFPWTTTLYPLPTSSTNGKFDAFEIPVYDYFGGIVNAGDQDSLYLRTFVNVGGQEVPANVYYRIVFQNTNSNYSETFTDTGYSAPDPNFVLTNPANNIPPMIAGIGAGDGIWTPGEPFIDTNGNGVCDPIVDPGERRLQRIVLLPNNAAPLVQDLGPATRFNLEYLDPSQGKFVAPFSDTGVDGLFDAEEPTYLNLPDGPVVCPDENGDNFFPGLNEIKFVRSTMPVLFNDGIAATENNGVLDLVNSSGIPARTLNRNPYLQGSVAGAAPPFAAAFPSGVPSYVPGSNHGPGENPFEGFKRFGYPEACGATVLLDNFSMIPLNAREQIPPLSHLDWVALEPLAEEQNAKFNLLFNAMVNYCDPSTPGGAINCMAVASCNSSTAGYVRYLFQPTDVLDVRLYRFAPGAVFDDEGWLRCSGVRDSFAFLKPGDEVFVWGFFIPPQTISGNFGAEPVRVPVPPGYYPLIEKRGERLRLDLSKVPGGAPGPERLRGVPAVYRAPYLPPALRVDFSLEGYAPYSLAGQGIYYRDLRVWSLFGPGFATAGLGSQGTPPSIPIRGTVFTVQPGQGSGTGSRRPNGLPY